MYGIALIKDTCSLRRYSYIFYYFKLFIELIKHHPIVRAGQAVSSVIHLQRRTATVRVLFEDSDWVIFLLPLPQ